VIEHRSRNQTRTEKGLASSFLGSLVEGFSKYWLGAVSMARVFNMPKVGGLNPSPLTKIRFPLFSLNESIGLPECPYMRRWVADFGAFAVRLHRWESSDDERAFHDHAWWFLTCVIKGSYVDISDHGEDVLTFGSVRFRRAAHKHTVKILQPGTWTLLITGPAKRRWGFWVNGKLWKRDRYFAIRGHHPCSPSQQPIRIKPDGTRI
jgi:hypothetical protein